MRTGLQTEAAGRKLLAAFLGGTLDPASFDHEAHVRVAWMLLERHELATATAKFSLGALRLATRAGVPGKFHLTLTTAMMCLIHGDRAASGSASWPDYRNSGPDILLDAMSVLKRHYSPETLFSEEARTHWVEPDLLSFPDRALPPAAAVIMYPAVS